MDYVQTVRLKVMAISQSKSQCVAHRLDHLQRVLKYAEMIARHYPEVDMEVLTLATLLHDIDHPRVNKRGHVGLSVKKAESILIEIGYPESKAQRVTKVISEHSTENIDDIKPSSIEAMILFDADKLDGVGASGIARVFSLFGQLGKTPLEAISWHRVKIDKAISNMCTDMGRKIFLERLEYVEEFLGKLEQENKEVGLDGQMSK